MENKYKEQYKKRVKVSKSFLDAYVSMCEDYVDDAGCLDTSKMPEEKRVRVETLQNWYRSEEFKLQLMDSLIAKHAATANSYPLKSELATKEKVVLADTGEITTGKHFIIVCDTFVEVPSVKMTPAEYKEAFLKAIEELKTRKLFTPEMLDFDGEKVRAQAYNELRVEKMLSELSALAAIQL